MIAALYVQTNGVYFGLPNVDPWDVKRDARLYAGPYPVVAHPPCNRWCQTARLVESRYGHKVGDDGGTFAQALDAVNHWGGVLEHPAETLAWPAFSLTRPPRRGWQYDLLHDAWTCQVDQVAYGHACRKRTWLYYRGPVPPSMHWGSGKPTHTVTWLGYTKGKSQGKSWNELPRMDKGKSSATTPEFRDVLIGLAELAQKREAA